MAGERGAHYELLAEVTLQPHHVPTGRTRHFRGDEQLARPASLRIVRFPDQEMHYLLYLGSAGQELTDTCHETFGAALDQAEWEFSIRSEEWTRLA